MHSKDSMLSDLKRVRGLGGAAHEGTGHFWWQRLSALALIPLSVWLLVTLITQLMGLDRASTAFWFQNPFHALGTLIFVVALALHAKLGMQVIIEDYVHCEAKKLTLLIFNSAVMIVFALLSIFAIARLHFIGI
jgi:succinate dehydrogenase / fumarate reductase membrane anchor subunit